MAPTNATRGIVVSLAVVSAIGFIDALLSEEWDLVVVLGIVLALSLTLVARLESRRPPVPVRRDLVAWLRERSDLSGEPIGAVTDRALATYRERYGQAPADPEEVRQ